MIGFTGAILIIVLLVAIALPIILIVTKLLNSSKARTNAIVEINKKLDQMTELKDK